MRSEMVSSILEIPVGLDRKNTMVNYELSIYALETTGITAVFNSQSSGPATSSLLVLFETIEDVNDSELFYFPLDF